MNTWMLMLVVIVGCQCIGYIFMPVFHEPWGYYITTLAFNSLWCIYVFKMNGGMR